MKFKLDYSSNLNGNTVKDNETYKVIDSRFLESMVLSTTELNSAKSTAGHSHDDVEEIYIFQSGNGEIELDGEFLSVTAGSIVSIKKGVFHRVHNRSQMYKLKFISIFQTYDRNGGAKYGN